MPHDNFLFKEHMFYVLTCMSKWETAILQQPICTLSFMDEEDMCQGSCTSPLFVLCTWLLTLIACVLGQIYGNVYRSRNLPLMILPAPAAGTMQIGCSVFMHQVPCFFLTCRKYFLHVISLIFLGRNPQMCRSPLCGFVTLPADFVNFLAVTSLYV